MTDPTGTTPHLFEFEPLSIPSLMHEISRLSMNATRDPDRLRMHPETFRRFVLSKFGGYAMADFAALTLAGIPVERDPKVPPGLVSIEHDFAPSSEKPRD